MRLLNAICITLLTAAGIFFSRTIIYILFLYLCLRHLIGRKVEVEHLITTAAVYSIIVPNNYLSEVLIILLFICVFLKNPDIIIRHKMSGIFIILWLLCASLSTIFNEVPIVNIVFSIISFTPLLIFFILFANIDNINLKIFESQFDEILFIEVIATIFNCIYFYGTPTDAWSCGTFSDRGGEQAQLFVLMGLLFFVYFEKYKNLGSWIVLRNCLACVLIMVSTFSWSLTAVFCTVFIYYLFFTNDFYLKHKQKIANIKRWVMVLIPILLLAFFQFAPEFIRTGFIRIFSDYSFFQYRFYKAVVYGTTFVTIPMQDSLFLLLGNGPGYFCSRAALICTGQYVDFYTHLFSPSISHYTNVYIMDYVTKAHEAGWSDYGSVLARPYSSVLALMGETGLMGILTFGGWYFTVVPKKKKMMQILLLFWLSVCFIENYFEYPKVLLFLLSCIVVMNRIAMSNMAQMVKSKD